MNPQKSLAIITLTALLLNYVHASDSANPWDNGTEPASPTSSRSITPGSNTSDDEAMDVEEPKPFHDVLNRTVEEDAFGPVTDLGMDIDPCDTTVHAASQHVASTENFILPSQPLFELLGIAFDYALKTTDATSLHYARWLTDYLPTPCFTDVEWQGLGIVRELQHFANICLQNPGAMLAFSQQDRAKIFQTTRYHALQAMTLAQNRILELTSKADITPEEQEDLGSKNKLFLRSSWFNAINTILFYDVQMSTNITNDQKKIFKSQYWSMVKTWLDYADFKPEQRYRLLTAALSHASYEDFFSLSDISASCNRTLQDTNLSEAQRVALITLATVKFYAKAPHMMNPGLGDFASKLLLNDTIAARNLIQAAVATMNESGDKESLFTVQCYMPSQSLPAYSDQIFSPIILQLESSILFQDEAAEKAAATEQEEDFVLQLLN